MKTYLILTLVFLCKFVFSRDFYLGMFKNNDFLVAQDRLYKERVPHRYAVASYGRIFKCPIAYFRLVDRLGIGKGPMVQITRGGLRHRYIHVRVTSQYNLPISVNIYVGCENKMPSTKRLRPTSETTEVTNSTADNTTEASNNTSTDNPHNDTNNGTDHGNRTLQSDANKDVPEADGGSSPTPAADGEESPPPAAARAYYPDRAADGWDNSVLDTDRANNPEPAADGFDNLVIEADRENNPDRAADEADNPEPPGGG